MPLHGGAASRSRWLDGLRRLSVPWLLLAALVGAHPAAAAGASRVLKGGWYLWDPYQYTETKGGTEILTGLDVELVRAIARKAGYSIAFERVDWEQHLDDLRTGARDIAAGAIYTDERAAFVTFSKPYRKGTAVLYLPAGASARYRFKDVDGMLAMFASTGFRLGVTKGYAYADPKVNAYIANPANAARIAPAEDEYENFRSMVDGRTDGFLADQIVGATTAWRGGWRNQAEAYPLKFSVPQHLMFSKASVPPETVASFDSAIDQVMASGEYDNIFKKYLYPVLVAQTLDSRWFLMLDVIGTVAFAISGVLIASREGYNLVGAIVLAALPAVGGGILRDILVHREPIEVMTTPLYLCLVLATVAVGFIVEWLWVRFRARATAPAGLRRVAAALVGRGVHRLALETCDAAGLAALTVTGVAVAVGTQADPLWLWGPIFAMLTGAGGGILRDIVRQAGTIASLKTELYAEVALLWGLVLSGYLLWRIPDLDPDELLPVIVAVVVGGFTTRMAAVLFRIRSPLFVQMPAASVPACRD